MEEDSSKATELFMRPAWCGRCGTMTSEGTRSSLARFFQQLVGCSRLPGRGGCLCCGLIWISSRSVSRIEIVVSSKKIWYPKVLSGVVELVSLNESLASIVRLTDCTLNAIQRCLEGSSRPHREQVWPRACGRGTTDYMSSGTLNNSSDLQKSLTTPGFKPCMAE